MKKAPMRDMRTGAFSRKNHIWKYKCGTPQIILITCEIIHYTNKNGEGRDVIRKFGIAQSKRCSCP